jgi:hypothetical protein
MSKPVMGQLRWKQETKHAEDRKRTDLEITQHCIVTAGERMPTSAQLARTPLTACAHL